MTQWSEITKQYDNPQTYGRKESYYGEGRYPPDWKQRQRIVWQQQSDCCGRCGQSREQLSHADVHHIRSLSEGGSNALDNLVGLCGDCHALMHPLNDDIVGDPFDAPVFPTNDAVPKVATVRTITTEDDISRDIRSDLKTLQRFSTPDRNTSALSTHTYDIEAAYARKLPEQLTTILQDHGVIAESSDYNLVEITVQLRGIRGILSNYTPELTIHSDGTLIESDDWAGRWRTLSRRVRMSEDTMKATLTLSDGTGTTEKTLSLDEQTIGETFTAQPPSMWL